MSEKIKLGEIIDTIQGSQYPLDEQITENKEGYLRFLRISDYTKSDEPIRYVKYSGKELICEENEVVVVRYGNVGFIGYGKKGILANNLFVLRLKNKNFDSKYLYYYLNSPNINNAIVNKANSSTMPALTHKMIKELEIPVVDIEKQKSIVSRLNKIQKIIDIRKEQIEYFDELVKSQFVEMFGNPFLNDKKWKLKKLKEISISIADGSNVDKKYYKTKGDVLFLRIQNVWRNEFRLEDSVFISKEENKEYIDTSLKYGDILICKIGRNYTKDTSLGRVAIYLGEDDKANYSNNIMKIRLTDEVNSKFVNMLLNLEDYQEHIKRVSKGGTDKRALNKSIIGDLPIILPPKAMQDEYINKIERIDKQKFEIQKSLDEIQELYESLMDKYFG